jgi:integrase
MRKTLTLKAIESLPAAEGGKRYDVLDAVVPGFGVRVMSTGRKSYFLLARFPGQKNPTRRTIAPVGRIELSQARETARGWLSELVAGVDPAKRAAEQALVDAQAASKSFEAISSEFLEKHVRRHGLRSGNETERIINRELLPHWKEHAFEDIRRSDVSTLLDQIQERAPVQADRVLAVISKMCNWYAARSDEYVSPIVRGMRRSDAKSRKRVRILDAAEIKIFWNASGGQGVFGAFVQFALLTGQRRAKVSSLKWADIHADGVWHIPSEDGEKANAKSLKLPAFALSILNNLKDAPNGEFVFSENGIAPINGFSKSKARLDLAMEELAGKPVPHWVVHDLRRTAKSLMAKTKVPRDISERVLGHAIPGVEGVYDQYNYFDEKADALERLNAMIADVVG